MTNAFSDQPHGIFAVCFLPLYFYFFARYRIHLKSCIIGGDWQMPAVSPVNKSEQFHFPRSAQIKQCIHTSTNRATGIQHIVDKDYFFIFYFKINFSFARSTDITAAKIVTVESDVKKP